MLQSNDLSTNQKINCDILQEDDEDCGSGLIERDGASSEV